LHSASNSNEVIKYNRRNTYEPLQRRIVTRSMGYKVTLRKRLDQIKFWGDQLGTKGDLGNVFIGVHNVAIGVSVSHALMVGIYRSRLSVCLVVCLNVCFW